MNLNQPKPSPIEIDPGELNTKPEVDYGNEPSTPSEFPPETPPAPMPEREQPHEPETEPGKE